MGDTSAPAEDISKSGKTIGGLKDTLKTPVSGLDKIDVKPGDFTEATTLKNTVNTRKGEAKTLANSFGTELDSIKTKMDKNADGIDNTEDTNQWEADGVPTK